MPVALAAPTRRTRTIEETARDRHPCRHATASSRPGTEARVLDARTRLAQRNPAVRDGLIQEHLGLVQRIAQRVARKVRGVEVDDLVGWGVIGLIAAIDRYDPARGVPLDRYAVPRIQGAMMDGLRSLDWVGGSRIRLRERAIRTAHDRLTNSFGRSPSVDEVADELGWTPRRVRRSMIQGSRSRIEPLDAVAGTDEWGDPTTFADLIADGGPAPADHLEETDLRRHLHDEIARLPEQNRTVLRHYFGEGKTLVEIGRILGVSEGRICQINADSRRRLRAALA